MPSNARAAGTPGEFRLPRPFARKKKVQTRVVTAKAGIIPGVPARLAFTPFVPSNNYARWSFGLFRAAPGGRTKLSTAGGPSRLRRYPLARARTQPPEEGPVASGRLAGTVRLQPLRLSRRVPRETAATVPDPHVAHAARHALSLDRDQKEYSPSLGWKYDGGN